MPTRTSLRPARYGRRRTGVNRLLPSIAPGTRVGNPPWPPGFRTEFPLSGCEHFHAARNPQIRSARSVPTQPAPPGKRFTTRGDGTQSLPQWTSGQWCPTCRIPAGRVRRHGFRQAVGKPKLLRRRDRGAGSSTGPIDRKRAASRVIRRMMSEHRVRPPRAAGRGKIWAHVLRGPARPFQVLPRV